MTAFVGSERMSSSGVEGWPANMTDIDCDLWSPGQEWIQEWKRILLFAFIAEYNSSLWSDIHVIDFNFWTLSQGHAHEFYHWKYRTNAPPHYGNIYLWLIVVFLKPFMKSHICLSILALQVGYVNIIVLISKSYVCIVVNKHIFYGRISFLSRMMYPSSTRSL